ncbi:hypothetical protein ACMZ5C_18945 [Acinetobacter baumannii]|uniref:hypothetical protein n=1 Tax=Acinetobacter baumannii TaxID=470 RepID=UPI0039EE394E
MAKRKYKSDKFQVRRINRQWWVLEKDLETNCYSKHEQVATKTLANNYADDYIEQYYICLLYTSPSPRDIT